MIRSYIPSHVQLYVLPFSVSYSQHINFSLPLSVFVCISLSLIPLYVLIKTRDEHWLQPDIIQHICFSVNLTHLFFNNLSNSYSRFNQTGNKM